MNARISLFLLIILLLVLAPAAAHAQEGSAASSSTLYLPAIQRTFHSWFNDSELDDAMRRAGYDPAVASLHTNCFLDPSSTPPHDIRYSSCEQYYVDGVPTEGSAHYVWYLRMSNGIVTGLEVGG